MRTSAVLLAMGLISCATVVESTWKSPELKARQLKTFAVFGVSDSQSGRVAFEQTLTEGLKANGLAAEPGYDFLSYDEKIDKADIIAKLRGKNVDAVLVSKIISRDVTVKSTPVWQTAVATDPFYGGWYGYFGGIPVTDTGMVGGNVTEKTEYVWETVLYDLEDNKPMWAARSVSSRNSPGKFGSDIANRVASELKVAGLVAEKK